MEYILCDLEATGNREHDRIIELGMIVYHNSLYRDSAEVYTQRNSTEVEMMCEAMEVHHITPDMLKREKPFKETEGYARLHDLNKSENILIAHDLSSDLKLLQKEGFVNQMRLIDTLKCSRQLYGELDAFRLQYLRYKLELYKEEPSQSKQYSIEIQAHNALSDVVVMKLLLLKLLSKIQKKNNLLLEEEAIELLIELSSTPILIKKFPFGKYKGEYIDEIAQSDYRYIEWMRDTLTLDEDMKYTLDFYL